MDGLKGVVPDSCHEETEMTDLFSGEGKKRPCQGCLDGGYYHHNGIYCKLRDWGTKDPVTGKIQEHTKRGFQKQSDAKQFLAKMELESDPTTSVAFAVMNE